MSEEYSSDNFKTLEPSHPPDCDALWIEEVISKL